mgnify:CR=1 FL=1
MRRQGGGKRRQGRGKDYAQQDFVQQGVVKEQARCMPFAPQRMALQARRQVRGKGCVQRGVVQQARVALHFGPRQGGGKRRQGRGKDFAQQDFLGCLLLRAWPIFGGPQGPPGPLFGLRVRDPCPAALWVIYLVRDLWSRSQHGLRRDEVK